MEFKNLLVEYKDGTVILTINRPEVRNSMDPATWSEFKTAVESFKLDRSVKVVIITGAGKTFASGADIRSMNSRQMIDMMDSEANEILFNLTNLPKPVIAAIDGYALGGGNEIGMACDIRIASKRAKFGHPEVKLGLIASAGATQRLQRLVGPGKAKELLFTGNMITADEAQKIGLVEIVVEDGDHIKAALELADQIKANAPVAIALTKNAVNLGGDIDLRSGLYIERYYQALAFTTEDKDEGTSSFIEKRTPEFSGK